MPIAEIRFRIRSSSSRSPSVIVPVCCRRSDSRLMISAISPIMLHSDSISSAIVICSCPPVLRYGFSGQSISNGKPGCSGRSRSACRYLAMFPDSTSPSPFRKESHAVNVDPDGTERPRRSSAIDASLSSSSRSRISLAAAAAIWLASCWARASQEARFALIRVSRLSSQGTSKVQDTAS